jgi:hypothetical protein
LIYRSYFWGLSLALLASGCCLPQLGGRYGDPGGPLAPTKPLAACPPTEPPSSDKPPVHEHHRQAEGRHGLGFGLLHGRHLGHFDGPGTPPGEVIPLPRFHPVPVRPVFEPQFDYSLPQSLEPPLAPIVMPPQAEGVPTPAKPVPDPA